MEQVPSRITSKALLESRRRSVSRCQLVCGRKAEQSLKRVCVAAFAARTIAEGRHSHSSSSSRFSQSSGSFSNVSPVLTCWTNPWKYLFWCEALTLFFNQWFGGGSNRNSTRSYTATGLASEKEENLRVSSSVGFSLPCKLSGPHTNPPPTRHSGLHLHGSKDLNYCSCTA